MKRLLILPAVLLLSACSTNSQMNVVDNLTMVAANDGTVMNPHRWWINGHPLQTTYVSLNGQLGLKVGQVCIASRFRSPFTNNCRDIDFASTEAEPTLYVEHYKSSNEEGLFNLLNAVNDKRKAAAEFAEVSRKYYACINKDKKNKLNQKDKDSQSQDKTKEDVNEQVKQDVENGKICVKEKEAQKTASEVLEKKRLEVQKQSVKPNRIVYNWADVVKLDGGVVIQEASNQGGGNHKQEASGYTIVNGLLLERYQASCDVINELLSERDSKRLKVVTMTLSADELYYDASKDTTTSLNANVSFSANELKDLNDILDSDVEAEVDAALSMSASLSSSGYLSLKKTGSSMPSTSDKSSNGGLTYYAVLTDLESFKCPNAASSRQH